MTNIYDYDDETGEFVNEAGDFTRFGDTNATLHPGDLVWVTGKIVEVSELIAETGGSAADCVYSAYLPGINPYTGQIMYLRYRDLIPVRG